MSSTQSIDTRHLEEILTDSITQQRHLVLTHHGTEGWRTYKAKFVAGSADARAMIARIDHEPDRTDLPLPLVGDPLGATFRLGHKKCMFSTVLESLERKPDGAIATLRWPEHVQQLQRRAYERVAVPGDTVIAVRFWRDDLSQPASTTGETERDVRHGQLEDISAGGMRIKAGDPKKLVLECTYRCAFTPRPGRPPFVLDTILRHREAADGNRASLGFQFVGLETTPEGHRQLDRLARLVSQFRRARSHRR